VNAAGSGPATDEGSGTESGWGNDGETGGETEWVMNEAYCGRKCVETTDAENGLDSCRGGVRSRCLTIVFRGDVDETHGLYEQLDERTK